jgi:hypothetical protein
MYRHPKDNTGLTALPQHQIRRSVWLYETKNAHKIDLLHVLELGWVGCWDFELPL